MIAPPITIRGLVYHYEAEIPALNGVDLSLPANVFCAVIGQNGSGKTTLAKHLNGLLRPSAGRVLIAGEDIAEKRVGELAHTVGYVFQNPDHQIFAATVREEIAFGPRNLGCTPDEVTRRVDEALRLFSLVEQAEAPPAVLGFGLRRLISIAAVYAMRPAVLILDEPTTGLDWRSATHLMALLSDLHRRGHTILLITHDMRLVCDWAPRTLLMHAGRILAEGPTAEVMALQAELARAQVSPPQVVTLGERLAMSPLPLTVEAFCERVIAQRGGGA